MRGTLGRTAAVGLAIGTWLILLGGAGPIEPRTAAAQDARLDEARIWNEFIPGLDGRNMLRQDRNRRELVRRGEEMIPHLTAAITSSSLLQRLHQAEQLPGLRDSLHEDMQAWFGRYADGLQNVARVRRLVNAYVRYIGNAELYQAAIYIENKLVEWNENVPAPELLNTIRSYAALAIGEIGATAQADTLAPLLEDGSRDVRARTIQALGLLRADRYAQRIELFLFDRGDIFVRSCAWTALRRMDARDSVTRLIEQLASVDPEQEAWRQRAIIQALEGITVQSFGENAALWRRWWGKAQLTEDPLQLNVAHD